MNAMENPVETPESSRAKQHIAGRASPIGGAVLFGSLTLLIWAWLQIDHGTGIRDWTRIYFWDPTLYLLPFAIASAVLGYVIGGRCIRYGWGRFLSEAVVSGLIWALILVSFFLIAQRLTAAKFDVDLKAFGSLAGAVSIALVPSCIVLSSGLRLFASRRRQLDKAPAAAGKVKSKLWVRIPIGLAALVVLTIGVFSYLTSGMVDTAERFFQAVRQNDLAKARTYLSTRLAAGADENVLKTFLSESALLDVDKTSWSRRFLTYWDMGELGGTFTRASGNVMPMKLYLQEEEGTWKIYSLCHKAAGPQHEECLDIVRASAERGNAITQYALGEDYLSGKFGPPQNHAKAVYWLRKAAEQGNVRAQADLGSEYDRGLGVQQSAVEAVSWYRKAAEQGNKFAQVVVSVAYGIGRGVQQDDVEALKWYEKAASQDPAYSCGHAVAEYLKDMGVARYNELTFAWLSMMDNEGKCGREIGKLKMDMAAEELDRAQAAVKQHADRQN